MTKLIVPPMPSGATWTEDQWKAIMATNKNILVAAAAGSGKTAVLVERIIQKLLSKEDPVNVDELLVVTFTSASAAEMRHRIGEALEAALIREPDSKHLRKQLGLLNKASISTIHSFCMDVIRKYYYSIDLDPGFRIADETEAQLLRDEVIDELFEAEYGKKDNEAFFKLVDAFTNDRSDAALQDIVRAIYDFARSNPVPEQYLKSIVTMYDVDLDADLDGLPFIQALLYDIELQLTAAREMIVNAFDLTKLPGGPAPKAATFEEDLLLIDTLLSAAKDSWSTLYEAMQTYSFAKAKTVRGGEYLKELTDKANKLRDQAKKKIQDLKDELFSRKPQSFLQDMKEMKPVIETLVNLVISFHERFSELKKAKGLVDYSDLEHYCLEILIGQITDEGELQPSEAALAYRNHFKEVYIDEYQDVNMVQETIVRLVSKDEEPNGNLFMVGDVKQAIYRFRLAEPHLFLEKYHRFTYDGSRFGLRIDLARNFRSRKEILEGTNFLFKQIMGVKVGEIEYDEAAELHLGAPYPQEKPHPVELLLIDQKAEEKETTEEETSETDELDAVELEASQLEAKLMAAKMKELVANGAEVYNPKTKSSRKMMYRDIVILLRSMTWAPQIMEEFKQQGIPIYADLSTGYFEATEVAIMLSLLRVIDNPAQDIPLASVLRSPIVGLNEEDMAKIRIQHKKGSYWDAVSSYCRNRHKGEEELDSKLIPFYQHLDRWRSMARQGSLSELIWQLYRDTKFYDFVGGLPGGKQRQANLRAFYDRARQYEETSFRGLFRFLRFIERMMERGSDLGAARALGEQEDVVRIMTIHSSKGLEFPVVFVAGLAREFNKKDIMKPYLLDKEFGFAAKYVNPEKRITYPSLPQLAFKRKKKMEILAEEMRILYVALTRAKESLYLIASVKDAEKRIEQWLNAAGSNANWLLKDFERASARSYLDWIGPALVRHRDFEAGEKNGTFQLNEEISDHPSAWSVSIWTTEEIHKQKADTQAEEGDVLKKVQRLEKIPVQSPFAPEVAERFSWKYAFEDAARHRSKQSVSEIKRQREVSDEYSGTDLIRPFKKAISSRPRFMQEKSLSSAERGTALHLVMQHVDLTKPIDADAIKELLENMKFQELLTEEQKQAIDPKLVVDFFQSPLGQRMIGAKKIQREVPFTLSLNAMQIYPSWKGEDEPVFIQGVIDCIFEDRKGIVLVDYKSDGITDRFKGGFEQARPVLEDRYRIQIQLYAKAIEQILKTKVTERYLFFFDGAHILEVE
ncbi:helicase-exonuclease AddAB subunit AddA [Neobacillus sp. SM06]|uniref:helicase-exonuclease AddAB subunit AddA n=1 Tax=Neobacillus sp. SM06 TaxID=3422492 RepID=UPI003D27E39F